MYIVPMIVLFEYIENNYSQTSYLKLDVAVKTIYSRY